MTLEVSREQLVDAFADGGFDGLRRWRDADDVDLFLRAAQEAGWRVVPLDTDEADGAEGFLEACSDAFELPDWFGMNWDALDEALADLDLEPFSGVLVVWTGWQELLENEAAAVSTALDVFATALRSWRDDGVPGGVLVAGAGPDLDLLAPTLPAGEWEV